MIYYIHTTIWLQYSNLHKTKKLFIRQKKDTPQWCVSNNIIIYYSSSNKSSSSLIPPIVDETVAATTITTAIQIKIINPKNPNKNISSDIIPSPIVSSMHKAVRKISSSIRSQAKFVIAFRHSLYVSYTLPSSLALIISYPFFWCNNIKIYCFNLPPAFPLHPYGNCLA